MSSPAAESSSAEQRAERIFYEVIERPPCERETFLNEACAADANLRTDVDELLRAHDEAAGFLHVDATASPQLEAEFARLKPEEVGDRIGNYKLLERIGEGGFGVVWVAEQEKPMRRRVALKIIKLGMDTKEVIARFEQERQALAMMDHPNIAKVFEAGATPFGRPYFVMELVRGIKITTYCDQANLPTADRLRLFIAVCHAVQHAHQKGIIHRDLKPSNILVTLHDGVPVPKVIDFGVAKATQQQRLTDLTIYTQFEQMIGTPLYMSPEQAEMSGLDIDTRSDIYSLGVLLYELLVGRTPFDPETLMKAGFDEMRRVIREQEPQMPSTFVSTMAVDVRTNLAQHRQTDNAKLVGQIRGDLDWIVMKALEKDRSRRYETAGGLAQDIQRHLENEPVQARPPTMGYRLRRMARRNKVAFFAASAVLAALLIGLGVSTWMFFQERKARERAVAAEHEQGRLRLLAVAAEKAQSEERKKAETEASKSGQVAQFLTDMLKGVGPSVALGRDTKLLREILDKTAERLGKDLKDQPEVEADLRSTLGDVYSELGEYQTARAMHSEALAIRKTRFGNEHPDIARSMNEIADALRHEGKNTEAETMSREALAMTRKLLGNDHPDVATELLTLAQAVGHQGRFVESGALHRERLDILRKLVGNEHREVADTLLNLAQNSRAQNNLDESETLTREALAMQRKLLGNEHLDVAESLNNLAVVRARRGMLAEAEIMHREALAMRRKLLGNEHPQVAFSLNGLANVLQDRGNLAEAEIMHRQAVAMTRKLLGNEHPQVALSLNGLASVLQDRGNLAEAEIMFREALAIARGPAVGYAEGLESCLNDLAENLFRQSKFAEAEPVYRELVASRQARLPAEDEDVIGPVVSLARLLADWAWRERGSSSEIPHVSRAERDRLPEAAGSKSEVTERAREAERLLRDCLAIQLRGAKATQWRIDEIRSRLGGALLAVAVTDPTLTSEDRLAKFTEAESLLLEGNEVLQQGEKVETKYKRDSFKAESRNKRDSFTRLARLYEAWNKPDKAAAWQQKLTDFDKAETKSQHGE